VLYASVALFLGLWIFKNQASLVLVFLTVMASFPLIWSTVKLEEKKSRFLEGSLKILKTHSRALFAFIFLFFGFVVAFSAWYLILPEPTVQSTFHSQIETIRSINGNIFGTPIIQSNTPIDTNFNKSGIFMQIFSNNIKVLLFCIFFSFFYGAGAIFILTWNASVIGTAIGNYIRTNIASIAVDSGFLKIGSYLGIYSLGLLRYAIHGIPEILSYFTAGLAGGIISVAIIKHDLDSKYFRKIMLDSVDLIIASILLVFIAGLLEVYITPIFF
ncbi:MAG: stage II sporulation protein M, partial [Nanoarchaeota archaeon]